MKRLTLLALVTTSILQLSPLPAAAGELDKYLSGLPDVLTLNPDGEKYETVKFTHKVHGTMAGVTCQTCHHTQKGDAKPEKCQKCHNVGGEAKEEGKKTASAHNSKLTFPMAAGQKGVSCLGCHKAHNSSLQAGAKEAPTKCVDCHKEKEG